MTEDAPSRLIIGPFNRVEGDLEVRLNVADGMVREAHVTAPMFRGFEQILVGRQPEDALVIAPRICGICSVSQSTAAARALAALSGAEAPPNGKIAADLVLACENAADHLTHFALFFMPDFARAAYAARPWFQTAQTRFSANSGESQGRMLTARARFLHLMGLLAGKWPHSLALQPGGVTKSVDSGERIRLLSILAEFRSTLEQNLFAAPLEQIIELDSLAALEAWVDADHPERGDLRLFLHIAQDLDLDRLGVGPGNFLSYGSFQAWPSGVMRNGAADPLVLAQMSEDLSHAWMADSRTPDADKKEAYSWCKAPRLNGSVAETGALARQILAGAPLAHALLSPQGGGNVRARVVMRLVELARLVLLMEGWVRALTPREPFCAPSPPLPDGTSVGLVEAARGALGHWLTVENGLIRDYQIVAPTTWNFSPRDANGVPGPLEQALVGTPIQPGETTPVAVQHVVRSLDPCMACTVH